MLKSRLARSFLVVVLLMTALFGGIFYLTSYSPESQGKESENKKNAAIALPTLREMVGQMLMLGFLGDSVESVGAQNLAQCIRDKKVGGVIFISRNFSSIDQVTKLTQLFYESRPDLPPWIAIDQEGGLVQRLGKKLGFAQQPSAREIRSTMTPTQARPIFTKLGEDAKNHGFNLNLAPVVDLELHEENLGISAAKRSYGSDAETVIQYAKEFVQMQHDVGILPVLKHFPGHGSSVNDPHFGIADVTEGWSEEELKPFEALFKMQSQPAVMVGHLMHRKLDPDHPASLSHAVIQQFLREKLGFEGVVICDDILMKAISSRYSASEALLLAINAGVDAIMITNGRNPHEYIDELIDAVEEAVKTGRIDQEVIERSYARIVAAKAKIPRR